jgi:hypothetical protein
VSEEVYPSSSSWFVQLYQDGQWLAYSMPTDDRAKALKRKDRVRFDFPGQQVRMVKETRTFTLDEGDDAEAGAGT